LSKIKQDNVTFISGFFFSVTGRPKVQFKYIAPILAVIKLPVFVILPIPLAYVLNNEDEMNGVLCNPKTSDCSKFKCELRSLGLGFVSLTGLLLLFLVYVFFFEQKKSKFMLNFIMYFVELFVNTLQLYRQYFTGYKW